MNEAVKNYRVAIIGCGSISANHASALIDAEQTICALCDIDTEKARKLKERFSIDSAVIYEDYRAMIEDEHPDCVHICTPHYLHAQMIVYALERNINVLSEKPICISMEQLEDIRKAAKSSNAQLGVCQQNRFEGAMQALKDITKTEGVRSAFGHVVWCRDEDYYASGEWRGKWDSEGGGVMINQALHTLDIMQWLCGMPDFVTAHVSNDHLKGVIEVEDTASALFEYKNGPAFTFFATTAADADFSVMVRLRLNNNDAINAENKLITRNGQIVSYTPTKEILGKSVWGMGHKLLIRDFYKCLTDKTPFRLGLDEAEKVVRLILSMYKSNGERIEILN